MYHCEPIRKLSTDYGKVKEKSLQYVWLNQIKLVTIWKLKKIKMVNFGLMSALILPQPFFFGSSTHTMAAAPPLTSVLQSTVLKTMFSVHSQTRWLQPLISDPRCSSTTLPAWISASTCLKVFKTPLPSWLSPRHVPLEECWPEPSPPGTLSTVGSMHSAFKDFISITATF